MFELPVIQVLTQTPKSAILPWSRVQRHSHPPPDPLILHADLSHTHTPSRTFTLEPHWRGSGIRLRGVITHSPPMDLSPVCAVVRH